MSFGVSVVLDGTQLEDAPPPLLSHALTGADLLNLANDFVSAALFGIALPSAIKSSALRSISCDSDAFLSSELTPEQASKTFDLYIAAIADALLDDPIMVAVLDGTAITKLLAKEDDFAIIAEGLFTNLDEEDTGKVDKIKLHNALAQMGVEMGIPPISECHPVMISNNVHIPEELGQAQFAQLLQRILRDIADHLADKRVVLVQSVKIINDSKLRKVLANEKQVSNIVDKILEEGSSRQDDSGIALKLRSYLENNGERLGLPPASQANGLWVTLLYDSVFADKDESKIGLERSRDDISKLVSEILEKIADQLAKNPLYHYFNS